MRTIFLQCLITRVLVGVPIKRQAPEIRDRFARYCEVTKDRPSPGPLEQVVVVQGSVETGRSTRDVSICGLLDPLERDNFMCIKGGLVQQWAQFAKQQHRHGLQGKRSERRARVSNSRTLSDSILSFSNEANWVHTTS